MGSTGPTTTTAGIQNKDPWGPSQQFLTDIMGHAQNNYNSGAGSQTWGGPLQAQLDPNTQAAMGAMTNTANSQMATAGQPYQAALSGINSGGMTPGMQQPMGVLGGVAGGQNSITTGNQYQGMADASQAPSAASTYLTDMAKGGQQNPYLQQMLQDNTARIGNEVKSSASGAGRYGSAGMADQMVRSIAATNNPLLANAYEGDQNRRLGATSQIDAARLGLGGQQLQALAGLTGTQGQNINNQMGAAQGMLGQMNTNQGAAQSWAQMAPGLASAQYAPAQALGTVGALGDSRAQQLLAAQQGLFQQQQQMPWTQLNNYQGAVSGLGGLLQGMGSTSTNGTSTTRTPFNPLSLAPLAMMAL